MVGPIRKKPSAISSEMAKEIAAEKADYIAPTKVNVDRFLEGIRHLKEKDENEYGEGCRTVEEGIAYLKNRGC